MAQKADVPFRICLIYWAQHKNEQEVENDILGKTNMSCSRAGNAWLHGILTMKENIKLDSRLRLHFTATRKRDTLVRWERLSYVSLRDASGWKQPQWRQFQGGSKSHGPVPDQLWALHHDHWLLSTHNSPTFSAKRKLPLYGSQTHREAYKASQNNSFKQQVGGKKHIHEEIILGLIWYAGFKNAN